jgi:hypothetical protein
MLFPLHPRTGKMAAEFGLEFEGPTSRWGSWSLSWIHWLISHSSPQRAQSSQRTHKESLIILIDGT